MHETSKSPNADAAFRVVDDTIRTWLSGGGSEISLRTAGDIRRRAIAAGVFHRVGKFSYGRRSDFDAWIAAGAPVEQTRRRGGAR